MSRNVGFYGVMKEYNRPVILALRLKVEGGEITGIEHVVARNLRGDAMANLIKPRAAFLTPVPPARRNTRQEMARIAPPGQGGATQPLSGKAGRT